MRSPDSFVVADAKSIDAARRRRTLLCERILFVVFPDAGQTMESRRVGRSVLWWSRRGREYSRDQVLRKAFLRLGFRIEDFTPRWSCAGDVEARLRRTERPDLVWVPCFRQREAAAAVRWSRWKGVPVVFDPLISAYDKQVFERAKCAEGSREAEHLLAWERSLMQQFDAIIADTTCHRAFFCDAFGLSPEKVHVVPVGAEEDLFVCQPFQKLDRKCRVLFYGSFIGLQAPEIIVKAAFDVPYVHWTFIGDGPLKRHSIDLAGGNPQIQFLPWMPYDQLPEIIANAHILLGIFGTSKKAGRVIPNKVFQSLASGRPVITRFSQAYPVKLQRASVSECGIRWVEPGSSHALSDAVLELSNPAGQLESLGIRARKTFDEEFSDITIDGCLRRILEAVSPIDKAVGVVKSELPQLWRARLTG